MKINLIERTELIRGAIPQDGNAFSRMIINNTDSLENSTGVRICFQTDSLNCSVNYEINKKAVTQNTGAYLFNGFNFIIYDENRSTPLFRGGFSCKSALGSAVVHSGKAKKRLNFELYAPSFNQIKELTLVLDPDASITIASDFDCKLPMIFLGGPMSAGRGTTFASAMFSQISSRKLSSDFYNLALCNDFFLLPKLAKKISTFKPWLIISEICSAGMKTEYLQNNLYPYLKSLLINNKKSAIILIDQPYLNGDITEYNRRKEIILETLEKLDRKYSRRFSLIDGSTIFSAISSDCVSFDKDTINDYGNLIYADKICTLANAVYGRN